METDSLPTAETKPPKLRWYQWRLRTLFLLTLLVAIGMSYVAVEMRNQRKEKAIAEEIKKAGGIVKVEPTWLGKLLRDDSLVSVTEVWLAGLSVTDDVLVHLQGLRQLEWLHLNDTKATDDVLVHLQGLSQLQRLSLNNTNVTDQGVKKLLQALPKCEIRRKPR